MLFCGKEILQKYFIYFISEYINTPQFLRTVELICITIVAFCRTIDILDNVE